MHAQVEVHVFAPDITGGSEGTTCVLSGVEGKTQEGEDVSRIQASKM